MSGLCRKTMGRRERTTDGYTAANSCSKLQRSSGLCEVICLGCTPSVESVTSDAALLVRSSWAKRSKFSLDAAMTAAVRFGVPPGKVAVLASVAPAGFTTMAAD